MRRKDKEDLLIRALEGLTDREDEARLEELLANEPGFRKEYEAAREEIRASREALRDIEIESMPEGLREEIRRAVELGPHGEPHLTPRPFLARIGMWVAAMWDDLVARAGAVIPRGPIAAPRRARILAYTVAAALLAAVIWQLVPERVSARRSIAVMGFRNETGDATLDYLQETLPNLLITSLEQSGSFHVTTMERLKDLFRQAGKDPEAAVFDEKAAFEICRRVGIDAIAVGSYARTGNTIVMVVKVLDTASGRPLETAQSRGEGLASILQTQVDEISRAVTRGEESLTGWPELPAPRVIEATTTSLDAYNFYLRGRDELDRFLLADAQRSLQKAVAIDSTFAVAYLYLSGAYGGLRDYEAQKAALQKAMRFASKGTERERLYIEAGYAYWIENDEEKEYRILRDLVEKYPAEKRAYLELGAHFDRNGLRQEALAEFQKAITLDPAFGPAIDRMAYLYIDLGEYEKAMAYLELSASLQPGDPNPVDSIAELYFRMGRLEESAAKYRQVLGKHPHFIHSWLALAYVSALQENYAEVDRCVEEFTDRAPSAGQKAEGRWVKAFYDYLLGRWHRSLDECLSLRKDTADEPFWMASANYALGYIRTDRGEYDLAHEAFEAWVSWVERDDPANAAYHLVGRALTHSYVDIRGGRLDRARENLAEAERFLPGLRGPDREYKTCVFQLLSAELALARHSFDDAVSIAERMPRQVPSMNTVSIAMVNLPPLGDVLARAYWKKGDIDRAVMEYERLTRQTIASPDSSSLLLINPLYHYHFGLVLEEEGDRSRARTEFAKFLELWKDADPDHPELKDARKRLAAPPA